MDTVSEFYAEAPQATASEALAPGPYVAATAGFEPTTLQSNGIDSTNEPHTPPLRQLIFCCLMNCVHMPSKSARSSRSLRSADQGLLRVPFARTSARQKPAFAVVGPSIWNGLPLSIRSLPRTLSQTFLSQLKAVLFGRVGVGSASE